MFILVPKRAGLDKLVDLDIVSTKAELLQEGIIIFIHLFARAILSIKKLKIVETKAT